MYLIVILLASQIVEYIKEVTLFVEIASSRKRFAFPEQIIPQCIWSTNRFGDHLARTWLQAWLNEAKGRWL